MGYILSELWDAICMNYIWDAICMNYGIQKLTVLLAYVHALGLFSTCIMHVYTLWSSAHKKIQELIT